MKPTIEDVLEAHLPEFHDTTQFLKSRIYAAMTEYASLNRQGCRWVKASERLPKESGWYCIKNFSPSGWIWFDAERKSFIHHNEPQILHGNVIWLDESIEPGATSSENYWRQRLLQEFKELNVYFNDLFHHEKNQVKDAGHLWIDFSDKFRAFERLMLQETESTTGRIAELEAGIIWALKNPQSVFVFNELRELVKNNPNL